MKTGNTNQRGAFRGRRVSVIDDHGKCTGERFIQYLALPGFASCGSRPQIFADVNMRRREPLTIQRGLSRRWKTNENHAFEILSHVASSMSGFRSHCEAAESVGCPC